MPVITSIKPQENSKRVNIYLDGKFGFGLDLQTFLKEKLKVEQDLTQKQIESIVKRGEFQDSYDKILLYAAIRPRSSREYELWFKKHRVHKSLHEEILNRLKRLELLDDAKFAVWWIQQRQTFRPKSKRVLIGELRVKGIAQDVIAKVLAEENIDEKQAAKELVSKKKYKWDKLEGYEKRRKIYAFLMQKGFDSEVIKDVLEEIDDI
jgi:regulatory protein